MRRIGAALGAVAAFSVGGSVSAAAHAPMSHHRATGDLAGQVIGTGSPRGCTSAAVVKAVARGGTITFDCGPNPITIVMKQTAKVVNTRHKIVLDGGGLVTLSGGGKRQILYLNTCDRKQTWTTSHCEDQRWPKLIVKNVTFTNGNASMNQDEARAAGHGAGGGGAIFDLGGQLVVVNSHFTHNRCHAVGPDLGGAAIRAFEVWHARPVTITNDTFRGGRCSNGSALSSIGVSWVVRNSVLANNKAIGHGANPARAHTPGGGSGGAIYCDGNTYTLTIIGTTIEDNAAKEGGGAVFFVSDNNTGGMTIKNSTLHHNPSAGFETPGYPGIFYQSAGHPPKVVHSTIN